MAFADDIFAVHMPYFPHIFQRSIFQCFNNVFQSFHYTIITIQLKLFYINSQLTIWLLGSVHSPNTYVHTLPKLNHSSWLLRNTRIHRIIGGVFNLVVWRIVDKPPN